MLESIASLKQPYTLPMDCHKRFHAGSSVIISRFILDDELNKLHITSSATKTRALHKRDQDAGDSATRSAGLPRAHRLRGDTEHA